jgi:hypothetical protein
MAWFMALIAPGASTNVKQFREAPNLSVLPGKEGDISFPATNKTGDGRFVSEHADGIARRLARAFLAQSSVQRDGERVTAEEITRLGTELDKAMGGLYTAIAQRNWRPVLKRGIALHEDSNKKLPQLPKGMVTIDVITGQDAMGSSGEKAGLIELGKSVAETFTNPEVADVLNKLDFTQRLAASIGLKTDGLVPSNEEYAQSQASKQQQGMMNTLMEKGTTPAVKGIADAMAAQQGPGALEGAA